LGDRKWAKSTLVLVPLFGVHYTVYCIMHGADGLGEAVEVALLVSDQLFASFQVTYNPTISNQNGQSPGYDI
jgi:glycine cleavage system protein P-like pyridoxal-binding family